MDELEKIDLLIMACESATLYYQELLKNFLLQGKQFNGFVLSGNKGHYAGAYFPDTRQIHLRKIDAINLYHEFGHVLAFLNETSLTDFNSTFTLESKDKNSIRKFKDILEERTNIETLYNKMIELGFPHSKEMVTGEAYWEYFERKLCANGLYTEVFDVFGAVTNKNYTYYTSDLGHGKTYWIRQNAKQDEMFAILLSLYTVEDMLQINILSDVFPQTFDAFSSIVKKLSAKYVLLQTAQ